MKSESKAQLENAAGSQDERREEEEEKDKAQAPEQHRNHGGLA